MPFVIIIGAVVLAVVGYKVLSQSTPFIETQNLIDQQELTRLNSLSTWAKIQPTGYSDKEKRFLAACQSFLDAWYGVPIKSTADLKKWLADTGDLWAASGHSCRPLITGIAIKDQPRIITWQNFGTGFEIQAAMKSNYPISYKDGACPAKYIKLFQIKLLADIKKEQAAGIPRENQGVQWSCWIFTNLAGDPDWRNESNGRSELTQAEFVARLPQLVASAFGGGA